MGGLRVDSFHQQYWQKQPLLVRQALPHFKSILTPGELAGLACEADVNSRLVIEKGGARPWQVKHGPLTAEDFRKLPRTHWTLLVTDVDKVIRPVADLLEHFDFIPRWRIDDVMISYAVDQGSVGPHLDSYDVFLLQATGTRRWQIDTRRHSPDDFIPGLDLRILDDFHATQEWSLSPGDMLYLPPGVAHCGVAAGECMTYSIGFRAPSHRDLLADYAEDVAARLDADSRYQDPDLRAPRHIGEIPPATRARLRASVRRLINDDRRFDDWLGRYLTETGPWGAPTPPRRALTPAQFSARWARKRTLLRDDRCRYAHIACGSTATLYVDGSAFPLSRALRFAAPLLSGQRQFDHTALAEQRRRRGFLELLCDLHNKGYLGFK